MRKGHQRLLVAVAVFLLALSGLVLVHPARAQSATSLAAKYAPVLHFASGEKFYPTSVDYVLSSSTLVSRNPDGSLTTVNPNPTATNLGTYQDATKFLNNKFVNFSQIAADYASKAQGLGYTVYVHVVNGSSSTVIQYWLFYAYNNGQLNDHQTDLEVVQIFLDASGNPTQALYSQHLAGENAAWGDVETVNGHPVVYVAQGSHANYFKSYQGRIGLENDVVNDGGLTITPDQLKLVILHDQSNRPADQDWLAFPGRWGYVGTDVQVATGMAGPYGPVFNDNGQRWADPSGYLGRTLGVGGYYFDLAWLAANLLLIFIAYVVIRGAIKVFGIVRLAGHGGLRVGRFLKGRGGLAVVLGLIGIGITVVALFLPWYVVSASSQSGPLAGANPVTLMSVDGIHGLAVNLFLGPNADSTSGLTSFASAQLPFAIFIGAGLVLLLLDIVGVKKGKKLGNKFIFGAITSLFPFIFIYAFVAYLPNLLPLASSLFSQPIPSSVTSVVGTIGSSPISGTASATFPVVGATTVNWGFGLGTYLFVVAAVIRIIAGVMCRSAPVLEPAAAATPAASSMKQ
jgi:hypothetical protein